MITVPNNGHTKCYDYARDSGWESMEGSRIIFSSVLKELQTTVQEYLLPPPPRAHSFPSIRASVHDNDSTLYIKYFHRWQKQWAWQVSLELGTLCKTQAFSIGANRTRFLNCCSLPFWIYPDTCLLCSQVYRIHEDRAWCSCPWWNIREWHRAHIKDLWSR